MRNIIAVFIAVCILSGCSRTDDSIDKAMTFRESMMSANGCAFVTTITADYKDVFYTFRMDCQVNSGGELTFRVVDPDSIEGISGCISAEEGKLTFDDKVLLFATLADGMVTPVSAPWLFINSLRSGYLKGCSQQGSGLYLQIDDSYADDTLQVNVQFSDEVPVSAEIIWNNRRVITMEVENFRFV